MLRILGKTGIKVTAIGMGAMPLSLLDRPDEATAIKVLHAAWDGGIDFIDTADAYCQGDHETGHNERLIAKALSSYGNAKKIRVATKGGCVRPDGEWAVNGDPAHLRRACEKSLASLNTEAIFLYQLHAPDPKHYEASLAEIAKMQKEGKIQHVGISNVGLKQLRTAQKIVDVQSIQNRFNPFEKKDLKSGLIKVCEEEKITYIAHSAAGGHMGHLNRKKDRLVGELAAKYGVSVYNIMLRWHLQTSESILPIPGASKMTTVKDLPKAMNFEIDASDMKRLNYDQSTCT